jgi:hypothetical protein
MKTRNFTIAMLLLICSAISERGYAQCQQSGYGTISMRATVFGGYSLQSDGLGDYIDQVENTNVNFFEAGNLWSFRPITKPYRKIRSLKFDLSRPVPGSGAISLGSIQDFEAEMHVQNWLDRTVAPYQMHSIEEIQSGQTVTSQRTEMLVHVKRVPYLLIFGGVDWPKNTCIPNQGALVSGPGTTSATISRTGDQSDVTVPAGAIGRLFNYANPFKPIDLGLYYFEFSVRFATKTP